MQTDDLIALLAADARPVRASAVLRALLIAAGAGTAGTVILMMATVHVRPDLAAAMAGAPFWSKFGYTLALAVIGLGLMERLARPGASAGRVLFWLVAPLGFILLLALWQLSRPGADMHDLMMGHTARVCAVLIAALSVPLLAASLLAMRRLAPTRLVLAGAAAGFLSGAAAATAYAFHCPETAAPFVAIWYTSGVLLSTAIGALLGPVTLRW
jgi:hypothetical protein